MTLLDPPVLPERAQDLDALLMGSLTQLLGPLDPATLALLREQLAWVEIGAGQALMEQGAPGDALFVTVSGRLRAYVSDGPGGPPRRVREMGRGQVIGELALFTDEPRSASVVALRDSVLVRLDKPAFQRLLARSSQASMALTQQIIRRLRDPAVRPVGAVSMALMAVSDGVDLAGHTDALAAALACLTVNGRPARVRAVRAEDVDAALAAAGIARRPLADTESGRRVAVWLDHLEADHDFVLLQADDHAGPWTQRCARQSDELLLFARADRPPAVHPVETALLRERRPWPLAGPPPADTGPSEILVLLHAADARMPRGTAAWLARRPVTEHLHLRDGHAGDLARLARIQGGQAVGLVLAGGGARGLAHLGVWRALREHGIEIDRVGGTSIGSVMATLIAADLSEGEALALTRRAFGSRPTSDFNLLPVLSLLQGARLRRLIDETVHRFMHGADDIADLWKPYYCVAANYSQAREEVFQRGPLARLMRASLSIPGALPPVLHEGELLCDGGTFNNFPVDVMRGLRGVGQVIGVDLSSKKPRRYAFDEVPGPWSLLADRFRPWKKRRFHLPTMAAYLMNVTILYSSSRQQQSRQLTDLHFNPPLERVGMLQWNRLEQIVQQGYEHAVGVLKGRTVTALDDRIPSAQARQGATAPQPAPQRDVSPAG